MLDKSGKIIIKNDKNEEVECDVLFTFDNNDTNKSYIVYTDNSTDDLGNIKVYANTYNEDDEEGILGNVETDEEWNIIEQIFSSINDKKEVE